MSLWESEDIFSWAACLGHCSWRKPIGLGLFDRNRDEEKYLPYLLSLMEWKKSPRWLPSQNPRRQPRALPFPPRHIFDWFHLLISQVFSSLCFHCFRVLSSVFLPRTIITAFSLVSALVSSPSNQPPWRLQKSKCSCLNPSVAPLTTLEAQTSWEAFKDVHKLAPISQGHVSKTHPILQPCRTTWDFL